VVFKFEAIEAVQRHLSHVPNRYRARRDSKKTPEVGGLLFGAGEVVAMATKIKNVAADPLGAYQPSPREAAERIADFERAGYQLLGTYHDHPFGRAVMSGADAALATETGLLLIVAAPMEDGPEGGDGWEWALFDPAAGGQVELRIAPPLAAI
jgi:proteasome lid subunit RPN8/RPN11